MRIKNRLWNPEHPETIKRSPPKFKPTDDLCKPCPNFNDNHCKGLCPPMQWIDGNQETIEIIPTSKPIISHGIEQLDYNQALAEMITDKQSTDIDRLESIRSIKDYRLRLIAACILAYIPQTQISKYAHISQGRISKLYRAIKR
jgi:hypothetical protein